MCVGVCVCVCVCVCGCVGVGGWGGWEVGVKEGRVAYGVIMCNGACMLEACDITQ